MKWELTIKLFEITFRIPLNDNLTDYAVEQLVDALNVALPPVGRAYAVKRSE